MALALEGMAVPLRADADGVVRVGATRVTLDTVIGAYEDGATAEQIAQQYPAVTLAEIYATIAFYLTHTPSVRAYLERREELAAAVRQSNQSRHDLTEIRQRLMARRPNQA
jgi:uncharacterized protein (DUF433 family)